MVPMHPVARIARVMIHVNVGVALGLVAWIAWSGWQVATGRLVPAHSPAEIRAWMAPPPAAHLEAAAVPGPLPFASCHDPVPAAPSALSRPQGDDL